MKRRCIALLLLIMLSMLTSCSPGHLGSNVIAFIRGGQLWTVDPDGANAFAVVAQDTPVVGYSWSPNHQLLAYRALDPEFARAAAAKSLQGQPVTGLIGNAPSTANTIGVDGGSPITIAFSSPTVSYSNPQWNVSGTRLLYRQTSPSSPTPPENAQWWISQNDQPGGIAIKTFPNSYSIPSLSYTTPNMMAIGNSSRGVFTTTLAGTNLRYLTHDVLPGHPLPATLERVLWQPAHQDTTFLYAELTSSSQGADQNPTVQLVLRTLSGQTTPLTTCTCTQFAWSPDGNYVLYSSDAAFTILNVKDLTFFTVAGEADSVPYWSPDSQFLLLDNMRNLTLVHIADKQQKVLLTDSQKTPPAETTSLPGKTALLQPVTNSPWAADSRHFLFLTQSRLLWQGQPLSSGKGLYTVAINNAGTPQGNPGIVDAGNDSQAGWTFADANTSFLY